MSNFNINKCKKNEDGEFLAKTMDGCFVRIICTNCKNDTYPLVGLKKLGKYEVPKTWTVDGKYMLVLADNHEENLCNIQTEKTQENE